VLRADMLQVGAHVEAMKIRAATAADAPAILAIYAPIVRDTIISFETEVPTTQDIADRIDTTMKTHPYLLAEANGAVAGYAYAGEHRARSAYKWSVDVTVYVASQARRAGVARALYGRLLPMLAERGFHAAFAGIALPNPASVGLHEAMGFAPVGIYREVGFKFGRWCDVGWWQRLLHDLASDRS
jgi:L-amino acid N-acyltransferase YncA